MTKNSKKGIKGLAILLISILFLVNCQRNNITHLQSTATLSSTSVETVIRQPSATITITVQQTAQSPFPSSTLRFTPTVSPNFGEQNVIAFTGVGDNPSDADIYIVNVTTKNVINLTKNPAYDWGSAWSPDGKQIAFWSDRNSNKTQLYLMDADGQKLALNFRNSDDTDSIKFIDLNSGNITTLIDDGFHNLWPSWSPDGARIAFVTDKYSENQFEYRLCVLDLRTGEILRLTNDNKNDWSPSWSKDGREIVFVRYLDDNPTPFINIIDADGSNLREIIPEKIIGLQVGGDSPTWSNDGKMIAFHDVRPVDGPVLDWINSVWIDSIFVMHTDGSGTIRLTFGNLIATYPDWRP